MAEILEFVHYTDQQLRYAVYFTVKFMDVKDGSGCFEERSDISMALQEFIAADKKSDPIPIDYPAEINDDCLYDAIVGPVKLSRNFVDIKNMLQNGCHL